ncbi:MAG: polyketide/non-ribosomal peptide synthetase [Ilumatobacteraceae bacterium]|nr:polyketide/non-ribosomal peptide synthetase [Ilumatobacteraceae bacterium]
MTTADDDLEGRIAVIGMSGRFPGARNLDEFWSNLRGGVESIRTYSEDELLAAGELLDNVRDPAYVRAAAPLADIDMFDAAFFGMSPRDAAVFDPQHRLFLECAWEAFEHAGYVGERIEGSVGVFASCGLSEYMFKNVLANQHLATTVGEWLIRHTGNDTNFLATRVSYELDLQGPSMNVQTACSSTLVTLHLAVQSLLSGECDLALAGGAVVAPVQDRGYFYKEGEILSPDGHCRAFDAKSAGTIISSACGCVLLKPLANALEDGDNVLAVIRGSAINNDGRDKVGYLAPSVGGQARVVAEALAVSGVDARDVSYVEAHGTGTLIGDPIEIAGLTQAYRLSTDDTQYCAIGSLKSNIGHTGEASGVGALIKTVLSLQHAELPPSLHYEEPNPQADFPNSPFFVNAELRPWTVARGATRIAGITGLGAGGTNAHVLVEEAPAPEPSGPARRTQLITVSARTEEGAHRAAADLAAHLRAHPDVSLADVAFTRLAGRKAFAARRTVVAASVADAAAALDALTIRPPSTQHKGDPPSVVFMMPGGGAQYAGMGKGLYDDEPVYRAAVDECRRVLRSRTGLDLRTALFAPGDQEEAGRRLARPSVALPALFATEYAMAKLLESWGITPAAMIGHSAGEYAAACLAGVISMEDGLSLVALRGTLFETLPEGAMLSVPLPEAETRELMLDGLSIAAVNAAELCVVSGPVALISEMEALLAGRDVDTARIHIDVAAHSSMLDPILAEFEAFCRTVRFAAPTIPYVSNLTGTWITAADVQDPTYWVRHLRNAVRFSNGIDTILEDPHRVLLEIGPGRTLSNLARESQATPMAIAPTLRHPKEASSDVAVALTAVGRAWEAGVVLDAADLFAGERRRRVALPTYPFDRQRYWVEPDAVDTAKPVVSGVLRKRHDIADWFYAPSWRRSVSGRVAADRPSSATWMVVSDGASLADALISRVRTSSRDRVVEVRFGDRFRRLSAARYEIHPARSADWLDLMDALRDDNSMPDRIVHMTGLGPSRGRRRLGTTNDEVLAYEGTVERDQASVLFLAQALSGQANPLRMALVTSGVHAVGGETELRPERALLHGALRVIPRELGQVDAVAIDVDVPAHASPAERTLVDRLVREMDAEWSADVVAFRRGERWVRTFESLRLPPATTTPWTSGGVYLITGGLGGIGLAVAEHIAKTCHRPTLVLLGRSTMPPEQQWDELLDRRTTDERTRHKIASVQHIRSLGAEVVVVSADVADLEAMKVVAERLRADHGRITGVIHSAGILRDALIALRTPTPSSPVVDAKAKGALVLERVLAKDPPDVFIIFSSVSSIIGLPGQIDYTAANAFLDAFAIRTNLAGRTRALVVNWNAWQEVGMAVDAARSELDKAPIVSAAAADVSSDLFDDAVVDENDVALFSTGFSRKRHWLLAEHVVHGGDALIPGTGFLELIRAAVTAGQPARAVELRDVFFLAPFVVGANDLRTLRLKLDRAASSVIVFSDVETSPNVTATAAVVEPGPPPRRDLAEIVGRCTERIDRFDGFSDQPFMDFGPRWGSLRSVAYGAGEAVVTTSMPAEHVGELASMWLHPALLDVATGSAQALIPGFSESQTFFVPFSYGRVVVRGPLPAEAVSHVRLRPGSAQDLAVFDITIFDTAGNEVVDIDAFTMRRVGAGAALTAMRSGDTGVDEPAGVEMPIEAAMREGILPAEGVEALDRILDAGLAAQVVASSVDLHRWIDKVDAEASGADDGDGDGDSGGAQYERPHISSAYTAPATPIERELASLWRELLGVARVGRDDDFFELGGQSLIAVRLFTRMRKKYAVDLPLSTLFEAPTIAQCASIVAGKLGITEDVASGDVAGEDLVEASGAATGEGSGADTTTPIVVRPVVDHAPAPFRSLVTIQRGGELTPFFCVHGSGGNVLNFRDLSQAMGRSQPFYGLQARGIDGAHAPHTSIGEMAAAYLEEVRVVQPHGPYMLGGYSGGGLIAYEMAQELTAAGEQVALVLLLDTFPPVIPQRDVTMRMRLSRVRDEGFKYLKNIVVRRVELRQHNRDMARIRHVVSRGEVVPSELRELYVETAFLDAVKQYELRPWKGRVVLLRAEELNFVFRTIGPSYGWDKVVIGDGFELIQVPGDHDSLVLEPNASTLVRRLRDTLNDSQEPPVAPVEIPVLVAGA